MGRICYSISTVLSYCVRNNFNTYGEYLHFFECATQPLGINVLFHALKYKFCNIRFANFILFNAVAILLKPY